MASRADALTAFNLPAFFPGMLRIAEVCLSLPVSSAWPERGASAIKRIKTRMRSTIKDDMLEALMQISINGPKVRECTGVVKESVQQWLKEKPRRKLPKKTATGNRNTLQFQRVMLQFKWRLC